MSNKLENWEDQLQNVINDYANLAFIWGKSDCLCFVNACVIAQTGKVILNDSAAGKYNNKRKAQVLIKRLRGSKEGILDHLFKRVNANFAQRGDAILIAKAEGKVFGIVSLDGITIIYKSTTGLEKTSLFDTEFKLQAWRVV